MTQRAQVRVTLPPEVVRRMDALCESRGLSRSILVQELLEEMILDSDGDLQDTVVLPLASKEG